MRSLLCLYVHTLNKLSHFKQTLLLNITMIRLGANVVCKRLHDNINDTSTYQRQRRIWWIMLTCTGFSVWNIMFYTLIIYYNVVYREVSSHNTFHHQTSDSWPSWAMQSWSSTWLHLAWKFWGAIRSEQEIKAVLMAFMCTHDFSWCKSRMERNARPHQSLTAHCANYSTA